MELQSKMAEVLRARREHYVEAAVVATSHAPAGSPAYSRRDLEQMVDGFIALTSEALDGQRRDVRTLYLETVIPSLLASGVELAQLASTVVEFSVNVGADLPNQLPDRDRSAAREWLARFFGEYVADVIRVGAAR